MEQPLLQVTVLFNQLAIFVELSTKVTLSNSIPLIIPKPHNTLITKYAHFTTTMSERAPSHHYW